jgi:hypothetical protein
MKIFFDINERDPDVKSETFWSHESSSKEEYISFFKEKSSILEASDLENCDYIFLPYKWKNDPNFCQSKIYEVAIENDKKIISFFNDDYDGDLILPEKNFFLFRTSTYKNAIKKNEIIMPAFCEIFDYHPPSQSAVKNSTISFCGNVFERFRIIALQEFEKANNLSLNFLYRKGFWAPEIFDKSIARKQFIDNMRDGLFGLCMRGNGNFSYRLYETMALGRIPIIINSNLKLPLEKSINWQNSSIIVETQEIKDLNKIIENFLSMHDAENVCLQNKKMYDEYFSPHGFIKNTDLYLKECE